MLIGRVRVFVDKLRWLSTLLINTLLPELLQLNAEFNLYSRIVDKVCHNCLEIELSLFSRFRIVTCELVVYEFCR